MGDDTKGFHEKEGTGWKATDRIGFYGCSGRLVRIGRRRQPGKPPVNIKVDCPACERPHIVNPMWRERTDRDGDPELELT